MEWAPRSAEEKTMKHQQNDEEMFVAPRPGWVQLTEGERSEIQDEINAIQAQLHAADQGENPLTPSERLRLEERLRSLKAEIASAASTPTGPAVTTENAEPLALNDTEAVQRALSNASPAERRAFQLEVKSLGKAVQSLKGDLERAGLVSTATAENVGSDDGALYAEPKPYWK